MRQAKKAPELLLPPTKAGLVTKGSGPMALEKDILPECQAPIITASKRRKKKETFGEVSDKSWKIGRRVICRKTPPTSIIILPRYH